MKVKQKKLADGKIQLDATATVQEVDRALNAAQIAFAQQMNLRPKEGKTVAQVVESELGITDIDAVVQSQAIDHLVPSAIDKQGIIPAFPPKAMGKNPLKRGEEYVFSFQMTPKPDYELSSYDPVSITIAPFRIDPAEVDHELAQLADRFVEYVTDEPHPVRSGDSCLLEVEATQDGRPMAGLSTKGRPYTAGEGYMPPGFDEQIIGMGVGETKTFTFDGPSFDGKGNDGTETVACTVTVKEIQKRVTPTITDAWVEKNMPMYRDVAGLRDSIEDRIMIARKDEYENYKRQVAAAELAKRFNGRIDDAVYESMQQTMMENLHNDLRQNGMTFEQFVEQNGGEQQFQMMFMMQIRETLVQGYALDAVFRHEKLVLSGEDIDEAARLMNPQDPKKAREQIEHSGRGFVLREIAERAKANTWLLEHAEVTVSEG